MTIKATSLLSIVAIWVTSILAVAANGDHWWILIFALLATGAVGASAWRRLGLSRLIAITGTWAGVALVAGVDDGAAWPSIFGFLTTGAVVYSTMRRDAWILGAGVAAAWLATGVAVAFEGSDAAWMCVFAFLTAGALSNSNRELGRGLAAMVWWGAAAGIVLLFGAGWAWLSVIAFILTASSIGFGGFDFPRGLEWDLFDRDEDGDRVKVVH